ncbi:uncharacterized protein A4U43_C01F3380 [Asparagus officinalis]|uniref:protein-serine/threonine phosphatase n=1 Tax=Asparagus officinalis TaxID=4686 RepID=A0A5P1FM30_ASPOF|nr:uncharacterized protein A4U43_C01F3380 [Asparagus officinalis]
MRGGQEVGPRRWWLVSGGHADCGWRIGLFGIRAPVLSRGGVAVPLSSDHKPYMRQHRDWQSSAKPAAAKRYQLGMAIRRLRSASHFQINSVIPHVGVPAGAASSRALNSPVGFPSPELYVRHNEYASLTSEKPMRNRDYYLKPYVTSEPEVAVTNRTEDDEFLILASDGLWDVISNEVACKITRRCLSGRAAKIFPQAIGGSSAAEAAAFLAELAMSRGSRDNISVVVVELKRVSREMGQ